MSICQSCKEEGDWRYGLCPVCFSERIRRDLAHHEEHGDMDGHTCLLSRCAVHYP